MRSFKTSISEMLCTFWEVICELWIPIMFIGLFLVAICWISMGFVSTLIVTGVGLTFVLIFLVIVYIVSSIILSIKENDHEITR